MNKFIGGIIILVVSIINSLKYLPQIAKIKKYKNSKVVSRKFYIISFLAYTITAGILISWEQWLMVAVFSLGICTTAYTNYICWKYYPKRERKNIWHYIKSSFESRWF